MKGNPVSETLKRLPSGPQTVRCGRGGGGKTLLDITITSLLTICMFVKTSVCVWGGILLKTPPFYPHPDQLILQWVDPAGSSRFCLQHHKHITAYSQHIVPFPAIAVNLKVHILKRAENCDDQEVSVLGQLHISEDLLTVQFS